MRTERVLAILAILGLTIKFLHYPGGMELMLVSMGGLSFIYFPLGFYFFTDKKINDQNIALTIPSGLLFAFILYGVLFKIQYWPGSGFTFLLLGVIACPVLIGFIFFLRKKATDELQLYYKRLMRRSIVMFFLSALFFFTPSETILLIQYRDPELAHLKYMYYFHGHNAENKRNLDDYIRKQDSLKILQQMKSHSN